MTYPKSSDVMQTSRDREPQWGMGKHSHGAPLGRKF